MVTFYCTIYKLYLHDADVNSKKENKVSKDMVRKAVLSLRLKERRGGDSRRTGSEVSTWECQRQDRELEERSWGKVQIRNVNPTRG